MKFPTCYPLWIEFETLAGWDSSTPFRSGCSTLQEVEERLRDLRALGEPWKSARYRVVDPAGVELEENLHRKDLTAYERSKATTEYVKAAVSIGGKAPIEKPQRGHPKPKRALPERDIEAHTGVDRRTARDAEAHVSAADRYPKRTALRVANVPKEAT